MELLLLQDAAEISPARDIWGDDLRGVQVIAWTPSAIDGLMAAKIPFSCPYDFCNDIFDWEARDCFYDDYHAWCRKLDNIVHRYCPEFNNLEINPFLHQVLGYRSYLYLYRNELDKLQCLMRDAEAFRINFFLYSDEVFSPLSRVLELVDWGEVVSYPATWPLSGTLSEYSFPVDWIGDFDLAKNSVFRSFARWSKEWAKRLLGYGKHVRKFGGLICGVSGGSLAEKAKNILVFSSTEAEVLPVLRELEKEPDVRVLQWNDCVIGTGTDLEVPVTAILAEMDEDSDIREFTTYQGVDLWPLERAMVERVVSHDLKRFLSNVRGFLKINQRCPIDLVVTAYELPLCEAIFQQCERLSISRVVFLHGGTVGFWKSVPLMYPYFRDGGEKHYQLGYTLATKYYMDERAHRFGALGRFLPVGSSYYKKLKVAYQYRQKEVKKQTLRVCYVAGSFGPSLAVDTNKGCYEDATLYRLMRRSVDIIAGTPEVQLFIKFGRDIERYELDLFRLVKDGHWGNIFKIGSDRLLTDLMGEMDVFIVDQPSSPFCELQASNKPFMALVDARNFVLLPEAEEMVQKRAVLAANEAEFLDFIEDLAHRRWESCLMRHPSSDDSFYSTYCWDDSQDAPNSAVELLKDILSRSTRN